MSGRAGRLRRVRGIASDTWLAVVRESFAPGIIAVGALASAGGWWWRDFNFGAAEARFLVDFGFGVQVLMGALLALVLPAQRFAAAVADQTAQGVIGRLVSRAEWVVGTTLGVTCVVAGFGVLSTLVVGVVAGAGPGLASIGGVAGIAVVGAMQLAKLMMIVAFSVFFASYGRGVVFTTVAGGLLILACHLRFLAEAGAGDVGWTCGVVILLPDFQWYSGARLLDLAAGEGLSGAALARWTGYACLYFGGFIGAAIWSFQRREF